MVITYILSIYAIWINTLTVKKNVYNLKYYSPTWRYYFVDKNTAYALKLFFYRCVSFSLNLQFFVLLYYLNVCHNRLTYILISLPLVSSETCHRGQCVVPQLASLDSCWNFPKVPASHMHTVKGRHSPLVPNELSDLHVLRQKS